MFHKFYVINCVSFICWITPSLLIGFVAKPCVQFATTHCVLASDVRFVIGIVLFLRTGSAVVTFSYLVSKIMTVGVRVTPGRPFVTVCVVVAAAVGCGSDVPSVALVVVFVVGHEL